MTLTFLLLSIYICIAALKIHKAPDYELSDLSFENTIPLRGMLAIFIVLHHMSSAFPSMPLSGEFIYYGGPVVYAFFMLSGYGLMTKYIKKKHISNFKDYFLPKVTKLVPPTIFCSLLFCFYKNALGEFSVNQYLCQLSEGNPMVGSTWYVAAQLCVYVFFYISVRHSTHRGGNFENVFV